MENQGNLREFTKHFMEFLKLAKSQSDPPLIRPTSRSSKYLIDGQICTGLKSRFHHARRIIPLNIITSLRCVLNNILSIYVKLHFKWYKMYYKERPGIPSWYSSLITQMSTWSHSQDWFDVMSADDLYNGISMNSVLLTFEDDHHLLWKNTYKWS